MTNQTFSVLINDAGGASASASSSTFSVADPAVVATGVAFNAVARVTLSGQVVATFTDPAGAEAVTDYRATINWGDGTASSTGSITISGSTFTVSGSHTYGEMGAYPTTVTISHETAPSSQASSTATVSDNIGVLLLDPSKSGA